MDLDNHSESVRKLFTAGADTVKNVYWRRARVLNCTQITREGDRVRLRRTLDFKVARLGLRPGSGGGGDQGAVVADGGGGNNVEEPGSGGGDNQGAGVADGGGGNDMEEPHAPCVEGAT